MASSWWIYRVLIKCPDEDEIPLYKANELFKLINKWKKDNGLDKRGYITMNGEDDVMGENDE